MGKVIHGQGLNGQGLNEWSLRALAWKPEVQGGGWSLEFKA